MINCEKYQSGECLSCQWLSKPYTTQLQDKQTDLSALLATHQINSHLNAIPSQQVAFRNKAKMVVSGSIERPVLGIVDSAGNAIDLTDCPLYPAAFTPIFEAIKPFIQRVGLTPYNVATKRGELKFILLSISRHSGELMLRFVLRSDKKQQKLSQELPWLLQQCPQLSVVSINLQPVHMAILEGDTEIMLTPQSALTETFNGIPLSIRPRGFFQTNPDVAQKLYATAEKWASELNISTMWDLFCGVGGFGLHCARPKAGQSPIALTGIEISDEAIAAATASAKVIGLTDVCFQAFDATDVDNDAHAGAQSVNDANDKPELVVVNPPRRGIGKTLCDYLSTLAPNYILYSSCNAQTMAKDIAQLAGYHIDKVQLFDMFPHTAHYEVLTLLVKNQRAD